MEGLVDLRPQVLAGEELAESLRVADDPDLGHLGNPLEDLDNADDQRPPPDFEVDLVVTVYEFRSGPVAGCHDGGNRHAARIRPVPGGTQARSSGPRRASRLRSGSLFH